MTEINEQPVTDELGLPTHIVESEREITGKEPTHQIDINLLEQEAQVDRIRLVFRSGVELLFEEIWHSGVVVCMIKTQKGQKPFAVYDPNQSGYNALKVNSPVEIF